MVSCFDTIERKDDPRNRLEARTIPPLRPPILAGSLFARHFLEEGIRETPAWQSLTQERVVAVREALERVFSVFPTSGSPNEAITEEGLVVPILAWLDWEHSLPQQGTGGRGRPDVPDRLLFASAAEKAAALAQDREDKRYRYGISFVESKRWQRPLDRGENGTAPDPGTPSAQMLRYLSRAEVASAQRIQWGILTNGRHWRLYWQGARSRAEEFFEVDLAALLGVAGGDAEVGRPGPWAADDLLRVFLLLFRRDAFLPDPHDARRLSFLRLARDESRYWEESVSRDLGRRVFQDIFPRLLESLIRSDPEAPTAAGAHYLAEVRRAGFTFLYRLLFVLYAEDRHLLPTDDKRYDDYSLRRLRHEIERRIDAGDVLSNRATAYEQHLRDLFTAISEGDSSIGLPAYDGGLFEPGRDPLLERTRLADADLAPLLDALSRRHDLVGRRRWINFRDLSVQHLGSIYERLLEFEPVVAGGTVELRPLPYARKASGSYYTPEDLVRRILTEAIGPLVADVQDRFGEASEALAGDHRPKKERLDELRRLDPASRLLSLKICDPAMGSGHFLVSLVDFLTDHVLEQIALVEDGVAWAPEGQPYRSPLVERIEQIRHRILEAADAEGWAVDEDQLDDRHIVRRILLKRVVYGVDKNPMAVELAKLSLWLHTFTAGAPLSFLDHRLRTGDSLYGEWIDRMVEGFDRAGALWFGQERARVVNASHQMAQLARISDSDIAEVRQSKELFREAEAELSSLHRLFDFWHALRWIDEGSRQGPGHRSHPGVGPLLRGIFGNPVEVVAAGQVTPRGADDSEAAEVNDLLARVRHVAERERFLHWELAFPDVWQRLDTASPSGGFDAVIGNPPWDRIKLQEVEWFAAREPAIARSPRASDRKKAIARLEKTGDALWQQYQVAREAAETASEVARRSGEYPLLARGDVNIYSLFVERAQRLVQPDGLVGLLVPSGIASDKSAADFFRSIATNGRLGVLYDFENKKVFFPDVDSRFKFAILVFGGAARRFEEARLAFFLHAVDELDDTQRSFPLGPDDFAKVNPNTGTAPIFRTRRDAAITTGIYERLQVLVDRRGTEPLAAWPVDYTTMFHMTNDSHLFRTADELEAAGFYPVSGNRWQKGDEELIPLYVGKMIHHYDHRAAGVVVNPDNIHVGAYSEAASSVQKQNPEFVADPQYWVPRESVRAGDHLATWAVAFRDIARSTDERTVIAAVIPTLAAGNTLPLLLDRGVKADEYRQLAPHLLAQLNSFILDYCARQKIQSTHVNWYIVEQLPVLSPLVFDQHLGGHRLADFIRQQVLHLTYTAVDMKPFARDLGYEGPPFLWDDEDRIHRLARLDALFFHLYGLDRDDTAYVLDQFPIVRQDDERHHGSYRTRELVLAYMNAVAAGDLETVVRG